MKTLPYMGKNELINFLKLGVLCGEIDEIIKVTTSKVWKQKLKTCFTYIDKIMIERLLLLDKKQLDSVNRRKNNTHLILRTEDQQRTPDKIEKEMVYVDVNDLEEMAELALNSCTVCKEGLAVEKCRFRLVMHRLGITVCNDDPITGQCEYRLRGVTYDNNTSN